jgi:hypothetical protein
MRRVPYYREVTQFSLGTTRTSKIRSITKITAFHAGRLLEWVVELLLPPTGQMTQILVVAATASTPTGPIPIVVTQWCGPTIAVDLLDEIEGWCHTV